MVTVFCLDVCPEVTWQLHPVIPENRSSTSLLALPSSGGALTRTTSLRLHSSYPSGPERLDLGETDRSSSTAPSLTLQTSDTLMPPASPRPDNTVSQGLSMVQMMAFR